MPWRKQTSQREADSTSAAATARHSAATLERETRVMDKLITFGESIQINGDLTGNEDLIIDGKLDGKIFLKDHKLTIGQNGHIEAEIQAKEVVVAGNLLGNITASDKVEVAATGSMSGDISAPQVILADGARFRGSIDMEPKSTARRDATSPASPSPSERGSEVGTCSSAGRSPVRGSAG